VQVTCSKIDDPLSRRSKLEISVKDNGVGISKEDQKKLFKLFGTISTGSSEAHNTSGIGLGLFISKLIVDQFNGTIDVVSDVGEGADFYFVLALEEESKFSFQQRRETINNMTQMFKPKLSKNKSRDKKPSQFRPA